MRKTLFAAAGVAAIAIAAPSSAAIIISPGPGVVQPDENVLANTDLEAQTVIGFTNQSNTSVSFSSLNNELLRSTASNGQARFDTSDGSLDTARFFLTDGGSFTEAEFNLFNAAQGTNSVTITVNGTQTETFSLGNGQNFFGIRATDGDVITSIAFDTNGAGVADLRQVRVGGFTAPVPEPATWAMMLGGFGLLGVSMRRRRRAAVTFA